jgi:hypothetical protein
MNKESKHPCGTYTKYKDGCRCEPCKNARKEYREKYLQECKIGFGEKQVPAKPLLDFVGDVDNRMLASQIQVGVKTILAWRNGLREIDVHKADQIASKLGVHPTAIWGKAWYSIPLFFTKKEQEEVLG